MTDNQIAWLVGFVLLVIVLSSKGYRRSRHIPTSVKRQALGRFYEKYYGDPKTRDKPLRLKDYEFDHFVPFAKGGTNEISNIRVTPKKENRSKGGKMPSFFDRF